MNQKNRFGEYISNLRREKQISLEQLCDGLCAISMLSRFERGEREPDKLLQNRFLTRLGAVPENYENFLYYEDYCRWEKRQGILHNILEEDMVQAKQLLKEYHQEYKMSDALEKQFYLAMLAQIRRYEGADETELVVIFERALLLTVPEIDTRSFRHRVLSLEELNLLLEYRYCKNPGTTLHFYKALLEYIEMMEGTVLAMAKIYPKTVYYYYESWKRSGYPEECLPEYMLGLCDKAIDLLRNANRMFYLWELLCMKEELMPKLPEAMRREDEVQKNLQQCLAWRDTLEELYREYHVTIAMYEFCYLYVESENYCIDDVVRIRRKMLGLSQEKLSKGICDSRTISRMERHICRPQKEIVQQLFDRLNLSTELCRTELVTESQEAIEKYRELRVQINNHDFNAVEVLLEQLKEILNMDNPVNYQALCRAELLNKRNKGELLAEECIREIKKALQSTVAYEAAICKGEKYLTNEEIACLENITLGIDWSYKEMKECVSALESICNMPKYSCNYHRMYEFTMLAVSNHFGNNGMYDHSDTIQDKIIELSLKNRRIKAIHYGLYEKLWNREQRSNKYFCGLDRIRCLEKCIHISNLSKEDYRNTIYKEKLKEIQCKFLT